MNEIVKKDEETYEKVFNNADKLFNFVRCEECDLLLTTSFRDKKGKVNNRFMYSHILTKGAFPEHRHNEENFLLLCRDCHNRYEFGDRSNMKTYPKAEKIMNKLLNLPPFK